MIPIKAGQINKLIAGFVQIWGKSAINNSNYTIINEEVIAVSATAGFMGSAIENVESTAENLPGFISSGTDNLVIITNGLSKNKLIYSGKEVYGRLTYPNNQWVVTYYYLNDIGVETSYTLTNNYSLNFAIPYRYKLNNFPTDCLIKLKANKLTDNNISSSNSSLYTQELTVLSTNSLSNLDFIPYIPNNISLIVNGETLNHIGIEKPFSVEGLTITWFPSIAKYNLVPEDRVIAQYYVKN